MPAICPNCQRQLANPNAWHYCAQVDMDELFVGKAPEVSLCFDAVLVAVADWPDVAISATKNCVVFAKAKTFLVCKPMKSVLDVKFYTPDLCTAAFVHRSQARNSKFETTIRLRDASHFTTPMVALIQESYLMS